MDWKEERLGYDMIEAMKNSCVTDAFVFEGLHKVVLVHRGEVRAYGMKYPVLFGAELIN